VVEICRFRGGASIRHRCTAAEGDEDENNSDGWTVIDDSEDCRRNRTWVANPSPYRTVTSESIMAPVVVVVLVAVLSIAVASWQICSIQAPLSSTRRWHNTAMVRVRLCSMTLRTRCEERDITTGIMDGWLVVGGAVGYLVVIGCNNLILLF